MPSINNNCSEVVEARYVFIISISLPGHTGWLHFSHSLLAILQHCNSILASEIGQK